MKQNRISLIPIIVSIAALALICTVREWVPGLFGLQKPQHVSSLPDMGKSDVFWRVDYLHSENDVLTETVRFDGYALTLTDLPDPDRAVNLYLISDRGIYRTACETTQYNLICQNGKRLNNYNVFTALFASRNFRVQDHYGFTAEFSTMNLPNGDYELGFSVWENETDSGFTRTGIMFRKNNLNFYMIPSEDILPEGLNVSEAGTEGVNGTIEHVQQLSDGSFLVEGMISVDGYDEADGQVFIEASDGLGTLIFFDPQQHLERLEATTPVIRHSDAYRAVIPASAGLTGTITIRAFILMPDGKTYLCPKDRSTTN